jgi:hypothetical protein
VAPSNFQLGPGSPQGVLSVSGSTLQFTPVPEPAGATALGVASLVAGGWARRRARRGATPRRGSATGTGVRGSAPAGPGYRRAP